MDNKDLFWFAREIRSIEFRNLAYSAPWDQLPFLRLVLLVQNNHGVISEVFESKHVEHCANPSWVVSGFAYRTLSILSDNGNGEEQQSLRQLIIRVIEVNNDSIAYETKVDISELVNIGQVDLSLFSILPANSVFLVGDKGLYVDRLFYSQYENTIFSNMKTENRSLDSMESTEESDRSFLINFGQVSRDCNDRLDSLRKDILSNKKPNYDIEIEVLANEANIEQLQRELEMEEKLLENEQRELEILKTEYLQGQDLEVIMKEYQEVEESLHNIQTTLEKNQKKIIQGQFLLESRQLKLFSDLQTIYPIEYNNGEWSIRGIELPSDLSLRDDDQISSALGYVVHLMLLASKYLEIPLRYQLVFHASRSMIKDPVYTAMGGSLPLFRRGSERERFDRAIVWLKKDIEQLLQVRGHSYDPNREILGNLQLLFSCEACNSMAL